MSADRVRPEDRAYDERQRYRIYRVNRYGQHELAATDSPQGIGLALVTLFEEGEWSDRDAVGVLDTEPWARRIGADWIVNPYTRPLSG